MHTHGQVHFELLLRYEKSLPLAPELHHASLGARDEKDAQATRIPVMGEQIHLPEQEVPLHFQHRISSVNPHDHFLRHGDVRIQNK